MYLGAVTPHVADIIVADTRLVADDVDWPMHVHFFSRSFLLVLASMSVNSDFKHFTCEIADQSKWEKKHQLTKWGRKANRKSTRGKAAGQKKAGMSRSFKASLTRLELQHIFD